MSDDQRESDELQQYLIGGPPSVLSGIAQTLVSEEEAEVLSATPDFENPDLLVVRLSSARAGLLSQEMGDEVQVELDEPLEPLNTPE